MRQRHSSTTTPSPFNWRERPAAAGQRRERSRPVFSPERILAPRWGGAYSKAVPSARGAGA
jgi:hypothetical protein